MNMNININEYFKLLKNIIFLEYQLIICFNYKYKI